MVEITLANGGVIRVGEKSEVMVLAPEGGKVRTEINGSGKIWSKCSRSTHSWYSPGMSPVSSPTSNMDTTTTFTGIGIKEGRFTAFSWE
jgi:hypothetical protein